MNTENYPLCYNNKTKEEFKYIKFNTANQDEICDFTDTTDVFKDKDEYTFYFDDIYDGYCVKPNDIILLDAYYGVRVIPNDIFIQNYTTK